MDDLLTIADVAKILKVHPKSIYRWVDSGKLKCSRAGRSVRFTGDQLSDFLNRSRPIRRHK